MSRDFSNTLLFESALDSIQITNPILFSVSQALFNPRVEVVEEDCETLLGYELPASFRSEGYLEVDTGLRVNQTRLSTLITSGIPVVQIRTSHTCTAPGGICRVCASSSFPRTTIPAVGSMFKILPEVVLDTSQIVVALGQTNIDLAYDESLYDIVYVFENGNLIAESEYTISGKVLTLTTPSLSDTIIIVRYIVNSNSQFYHWICGTYSGSLLGVKQLQKTLLPIRKQILEARIPTEDLSTLTTDLKNSAVGEEDSVQYIESIRDPVEKAIYIVLLSSIFLNDT